MKMSKFINKIRCFFNRHKWIKDSLDPELFFNDYFHCQNCEETTMKSRTEEHFSRDDQ